MIRQLNSLLWKYIVKSVIHKYQFTGIVKPFHLGSGTIRIVSEFGNTSLDFTYNA